MLSRAIEFLSEVKVEVKKVTWPSRKEAMGGTAVVLVVVFLTALFLGIVDAILSRIIRELIS
ncbi:MAG: preprotein translocase subunit SecE [Nitrospinaceae bacterium]